VTVKSGQTVIGTSTSNASGYWKFCDLGNSGNYSILFTAFGGSYDFAWIADHDGTYDLEDFGANGVDAIDDKRALKSSIFFIASKNGGKLVVPKGQFYTSEGIVLPPGLIIEGTNGSTNSNCRITLLNPPGSNKWLFKIAESTNGISIRDVMLSTDFGQGTYLPGTKAIYAEGAFPNSSIGLAIRDVTILGFEWGIDVKGTDTYGRWQFDQIRVDHATIAQCVQCIRIDTQNSDWQISNSWLGPLEDGFGINILKSGFLLIENTIGAGPTSYVETGGGPSFPVPIGSDRAAETFIQIAGPHGTIKIDNSQCEQFRQSIVVDYEDYTSPIMVANSVFGDSIIFKKNATFVSAGNFYLSDTVETWVAGQQPHFIDGTSFTQRMVRDGCAVPDQSCCVPQSVPVPAIGTANNVKIYSVGDAFNFYNRYWCTNSFASGSYPRDFIVSGNSAVFGGTTNTTFEKNVGVGSLRPGSGLSGSPTVLEVEAKNDQMPWIILNRSGATSGNSRWGWVIGPDGSLFLQQIGVGNRLMVDTNGNIVPQFNGTGDIGTADLRWRSIRAINIQPGDLILTDAKTGEQLYTINEDKENIYFKDFRTNKLLMRLDRDGNLHVAGKVIEGGKASRKKVTPRKRKAIRK